MLIVFIQLNTYQVVIATDGSETYVLFLYRDVQRSRARTNIGFNAGDGIRGFNLPRPFGRSDYQDITNSSNVGIPGSYYFRVDQDILRQPQGMVITRCRLALKLMRSFHSGRIKS